MDLLPNATLLPMWLVYMACIFVLNFLVFKPTLALLEKRKKLTVGLDKESENLKNLTLTKIQEYELHISEATKVAHLVREQIIKSAESQQKEIIAAARKKADEFVSIMKAQIVSESTVALGTLRTESQNLANAILEKLIDRRAA